MGIDYTEWHRREIEKAERTHAEHLKRADDEAFDKINDMYSTARDFGASHELAWDLAKRSVGDDANDEPGDRAPVSDHHASKVADLLVEAGSFPHRAAALHHVLHSASGQALLSRLRKAADQPAKETAPMTDTAYSIMKDAGISGTCAAILSKGHTTITESELVEAASKVAAERYPGLTEAQAFDKVYW
jgi:hypothetical protein